MFILASASPRRAELLTQIGASFRVAVSEAEEAKEGEAAELVLTNAAAAREMLAALSGRAHEVLTGVAWVRAGQEFSAVVRTRVFFAPLSAAAIARYVETGEPLDKAGAYAVQGRAALFVERLEGSYSNVVGLPLYETAALAEKAGVDLYDASGA